MNWLIPAISTLFLTGIFNTYMEYAGKTFVKGNMEQIIYFMAFFALGGLFSFIALLYFRSSQKKAFNNVFNKDFSYSKLLIPGLLLPIAMFLNMIALGQGGGIVMTIINLNMLVTIFAGAYFLGDKIDASIIISTLIAICFIAFASYRSIKIN